MSQIAHSKRTPSNAATVLRTFYRLSTRRLASKDATVQAYLRAAFRFLPARGAAVIECIGSRRVVRNTHGTWPPAAKQGPASAARTPILIGCNLFGHIHWDLSPPASRKLTREQQEVAGLVAEGIALAVANERVESQNAAKVQSLTYQAHHDSLTGLANRFHFSNLLGKCASDMASGCLAVAFFDLDRFKQINDTLGHTVGDLVLKLVGKRLGALLESGDLAGRMGGDEFAISLPRNSEDAALNAARAIFAALQESYLVRGSELFVPASMGVSFCPRDGNTAALLLRDADIALYRAKRRGGNDIQLFDASSEPGETPKFQLENGMRRALERKEFELTYQPLVCMDGRLDGMETLLTWNHGSLGRIAPKLFIPVAEESGLIVPIGAWVLREACRRAAAWKATVYPAMSMSVNVSALQFARLDFVETVREALDDSGLPPDCLELELTESAVVSELDESVRRMSRLRDLGVRLAIDDFGTGYSSLTYLRKVPATGLKIADSFVADLETSQGSLVLVQSIITLGHNLNMSVTAEGVETFEQSRLLRASGCDKVQGHFYGKPLPEAEAERFILKHWAPARAC